MVVVEVVSNHKHSPTVVVVKDVVSFTIKKPHNSLIEDNVDIHFVELNPIEFNSKEASFGEDHLEEAAEEVHQQFSRESSIADTISINMA